MSITLKSKKTIAEFRAETEAQRASYRERDVSEKSNPHLEALQRIITDTESSKVNNLAKRLRDLLSEMQESPLVLKVNPNALAIISQDSYKYDLQFRNAFLYDRRKRDEFIHKALDIMDVLETILNLEGSELQEDWVTEKVGTCLFWILSWIREVEALDSLEPEEAALAILAGYGFEDGQGFDTFQKELQKASMEMDNKGKTRDTIPVMGTVQA